MGSRQRYGLGLLWNPETGSFLQSQATSDTAAWGTKVSGSKVYESKDLITEMFVNGTRIVSKAGATDLPTGDLLISYPLGNIGKKSLHFQKNEIEVNVQHTGSFTENLPLLVNENDKIDISEQGLIRLTKNGTEIQITYDTPEKASLQRSNIKSGNQSVVTVIISAKEKLKYTIQTVQK